MKSAGFRYHDPQRIDDLLSLLGRFEDAKILAGGQSLMPMMNMRFVQPEHVIDINGVQGLDGIHADAAAGKLRIGAMVRQKTLMQSAALRAACPMVPQAVAHVGHFQTRARGTIGGSLCHLDPAAELPLVMLLHDAVLTVQSATEVHQVDMADWALAYMLPAISPDEALIEVALPLAPGWTGSGFVEFARRHGDFAIASAGCLLDVDDRNIIRRAAIAVGGVAQVPTRLPEAEALLVGQPASAPAFAAASDAARKIDALSDAYYTAAYRQRLAGVLVERALGQASKGTDHG
ncbi:MAG: FAD binding domain-containing protein [Gemmobacter sp.]|nr:FAD binding domain-containing protein [Gemmobacter sp.]